ncbi:MAG: hypothetical protein MI924_04795 [Chloroflexales bacterium]|nr:hypothetical protein [Chloroflexales bacterium]
MAVANIQRIQILAAEYVALVDMMREGRYTDDAEWRQLASARTLVHNELIALTGITERKAMYAHCRNLLARCPQG